MVEITVANIRKFAPNVTDELAQAIVDGWPAAEAAGLTTPMRIQHFFAQIATETGGITRIDENLNYSAERLHAVFPKRFPTVADAAPFAHNPETLANKVYGGRLGNNQNGDGWTYRGSGFIQTTGRDNFRACGAEDDADSLRTPGPGFAAALKYWSDHNINATADTDDVEAVRAKINPAKMGLQDAKDHLKRARTVFV